MSSSRAGLAGKMLTSHLWVAAVGLVGMGLSLAAILWLRSSGLTLAEVRGPATRAALTALSGVERSLSSLRGYVAVGETAFLAERRAAWDEEILPALSELDALLARTKASQEQEHVRTLRTLLHDIEERQWWIEDVALTPGNNPLTLLWLRAVSPASKDMFQALADLLDQEQDRGGVVSQTSPTAALTDIEEALIAAATHLAEYIERGLEPDLRGFDASKRKAAAALTRLEEHVPGFTIEEMDSLNWFRASLATFLRSSRRCVVLRQEGQTHIAQTLLSESSMPVAREAQRLLRDLTSHQRNAMDQEAASVINIGNAAAILCLALVAGMAGAAYGIARRGAARLARPVNALAAAAVDLAARRSTEDISAGAYLADTEIGDLAASFNHMRASLLAFEAAIEQRNAAICNAVERLSSAGTQIVAASTEQASSAQEQAAAVHETLHTVALVAETSLDAAKSAGILAEASARARVSAVKGRKAVENALAALDGVKSRSLDAAKRVEELERQLDSLDRLNLAITDMAEQINVLAVNAAIEAAKAGDHGHGFEVLAKEIRGLSRQSKSAASESRSILAAVFSSMEIVSKTSAEGVRGMEALSATAAQSGDAILSLDQTAAEASTQAESIAALSEQQAHSLSQIRLSMEQVQLGASQTLESARQHEDAAKNLQTLGRELKTLLPE